MRNPLGGEELSRNQVAEAFGERALSLKDGAGGLYAIAHALMEINERLYDIGGWTGQIVREMAETRSIMAEGNGWKRVERGSFTVEELNAFLLSGSDHDVLIHSDGSIWERKRSEV